MNPSPEAVYRISEKEPVFPCWVWTKPIRKVGFWQKVWSLRTFDPGRFGGRDCVCTHWSDAPEAPKDAPDKQYEGMRIETVYIPGEPSKDTTITKGFGFISSAPIPLSPAEGTPLTDKAELPATKKWFSGDEMVVPADFARSLERQLTTARRESEGLRAERENWRMSSVCREKEAEIVSLKAELGNAKVHEKATDEIATEYAIANGSLRTQLSALQSALGKAEELIKRIEERFIKAKISEDVSADEDWLIAEVYYFRTTIRSAQRTPGEGKGE